MRRKSTTYPRKYKPTVKRINGKRESQGNRVYETGGVSISLTANGGGLGAKTGLYAFKVKRVSRKDNCYNVSIGEDNIGALTANMHKGIDASGRAGVAVLTPDRTNKRQNGRRFKNEGEPSFTITAQDRHGVYDGIRVRRLTPIECERLMGIPDNWTQKGIANGQEVLISDTQRYRMCGNGVVPACVKVAMGLL